MAKLTDKQKRDYLFCPYCCPFCGSTAVGANGHALGIARRRQKTRCRTCGAKWTDVYTLTDVETEKD